ncbi:oligosaccharide flippase family protein [Akkermansiaceae bacterium]|nr:oligosaccharide flippase family protein [Akkermansiaceae bacterium]
MAIEEIKKFFSYRLVSNIFYLSILQGINYLLPFLALPFLFINLGPEHYGLVAFAYSVSLFLTILVDFGYDLYSTREISINRDNKIKREKIFSVTMIAKLFLLFLAFLLLVGLTLTVEKFKINSHIHYMMFLIVVGNYLSPTWYFQGIEKMKYVTVIHSLSKLLSFLPMFIFIRSSEDIIYAPLFYGIGYLSSGILSLWIAVHKFKVKFTLPSRYEIKDSLLNSSNFFLSRATVSFYTTCNIIVIGLTYGDVLTGFYSIAEKIYQAFASLMNPLTLALYPYMAKTRNVILFKKILGGSVAISFVLVGFIYTYSEEIIDIIFDSRNAYSINVLKILIIGGLAIVPSYLLGYPFLAAMGYTRYTNNTVIIVGLNHLFWLVILYFSGNITLYSISILIVVSEFSALTVRLYGVKKFNLFRNPLGA